MHNTPSVYGVQLFDDIHTYLPDILYNPGRFTSVQSLLEYIRMGADSLSPYQRGLSEYRERTPTTSVNLPPPTVSLNPPPQTLPTSLRARPVQRNPTLYGTPIITTFIEETTDYTTLLNQLLNPQALRGFLDQPVTVMPTIQQINIATTIETVQGNEGGCAICQDDMVTGNEIRKITVCGHTFHKECIDTWFARNVRCPTCRHDIREQNRTEPVTN
jgi:hypothetical protein